MPIKHMSHLRLDGHEHSWQWRHFNYFVLYKKCTNEKCITMGTKTICITTMEWEFKASVSLLYMRRSYLVYRPSFCSILFQYMNYEFDWNDLRRAVFFCPHNKKKKNKKSISMCSCFFLYLRSNYRLTDASAECWLNIMLSDVDDDDNMEKCNTIMYEQFHVMLMHIPCPMKNAVSPFPITKQNVMRILTAEQDLSSRQSNKADIISINNFIYLSRLLTWSCVLLKPRFHGVDNSRGFIRAKWARISVSLNHGLISMVIWRGYLRWFHHPRQICANTCQFRRRLSSPWNRGFKHKTFVRYVYWLWSYILTMI